MPDGPGLVHERACINPRLCIYSAEGFFALRRVMRRFLTTVLFTLAICGSLMAQFSSSVEGTVTDPSGAAVPNAKMTLLNKATGIQATVDTNTAGYFLFPSLPAGTYK